MFLLVRGMVIATLWNILRDDDAFIVSRYSALHDLDVQPAGEARAAEKQKAGEAEWLDYMAIRLLGLVQDYDAVEPACAAL